SLSVSQVARLTFRLGDRIIGLVEIVAGMPCPALAACCQPLVVPATGCTRCRQHMAQAAEPCLGKRMPPSEGQSSPNPGPPCRGGGVRPQKRTAQSLRPFGSERPITGSAGPTRLSKERTYVQAKLHGCGPVRAG